MDIRVTSLIKQERTGAVTPKLTLEQTDQLLHNHNDHDVHKHRVSHALVVARQS